jgi:hypothetical protein
LLASVPDHLGRNRKPRSFDAVSPINDLWIKIKVVEWDGTAMHSDFIKEIHLHNKLRLNNTIMLLKALLLG